MSTGAECIELMILLLFNFNGFLTLTSTAESDEFFFYKMVKKKRILRTFAENPSDLIQFALVKKSVMKSFPSLAEKKI